MINYQEVHECHAHVHILFVQPESGIFGLRELTWHISELTQSGPNPPEYGCTQRQRCTCMHVRMYGCMYVPTYVRIICIIRKLYTYRVCIILSIVRVSIITVHVSCTYPFIIIHPLIFCHCWILLEHCFDRL